MITAISSNCEVCCPLLPPTKKNSPLTKKKVFFQEFSLPILCIQYTTTHYLLLLVPLPQFIRTTKSIVTIRLWNKPGLRFKVFEWFWRFQVCFWWRNLGSGSIERLPIFLRFALFQGGSKFSFR